MRSGRSEAGMARFSPSGSVFRLRERCGCSRNASQGKCATAIAATSMTAKSSASVCFECGETALHASAQESQTRGSDDVVSLGHFSPLSSGQLLGRLSGASYDFWGAGTPSVQHSTRMPARQSVGIATRLQTTGMSAIIRIAIVYATPWRASTNLRLIAVSAW